MHKQKPFLGHVFHNPRIAQKLCAEETVTCVANPRQIKKPVSACATNENCGQ